MVLLEPLLLDVERLAQPDDLTCGPTSLLQVYRYLGYSPSIEEVVADTPRNPDGGTLAVYLGLAALKRGFRPTIYSYDFRVFDPTWWGLPTAELLAKLRQRAQYVRSAAERRIVEGHLELLERGGRVLFRDLERELLVRLLAQGRPILAGLSATYLYRTPRELDDQYDDVRGYPVGHFVVISGYYPKSDRFVVCDPSPHSPFSRSGRYSVRTERLIAATLLGDSTYDGVLMVLDRRSERAGDDARAK